MNKTRIATKLVNIILVISLGATAVLWCSHIRLTRNQKFLEEKLREADSRMTFLKKKRVEEGRVLQTRQLRERSTLAGQVQSAEAQVEALRKEKEQLAQKYASLLGLKKRVDRDIQALACRFEEVSEGWEKTKKELAVMTLRCREADTKATRLVKEKQDIEKTLNSKLEKVNKEFAQCESHNARLCLIADELMERYQSKGVVNALLQKEPFTQFKKAELEELMQEYREKVNQQKLHTASSQPKP
ncbi:MAG: hypothetical protein AB1611_11685 [bacterium]